LRTDPSPTRPDTADTGLLLRAAGARPQLDPAEPEPAANPATAVGYLHLVTGSEVVLRLHRLGPLLGCSRGQLDALLPLLLQLEALVHRGDLDAEAGADSDWRRGVELVLAAHRLDTPAALGHLDSLERSFAWEREVVRGAAEPDEQELRALTHLRCADVRLLVQVLCDALGVAAPELLVLLDPLLALREVHDDERAHRAGGAAGRFNLAAEYVRLFGESRGPERLRRERQRLGGELLRQWAQLPRRRALALWAAVFDSDPPWTVRALLPTSRIVRRAARRLAEPVPHGDALAGVQL